MSDQNKRKHSRYETDIKVLFHVPYDFRTEVDFALTDNQPAEKYTGISRNLSAYGLCFETNKELRIEDRLWLEFHLPDTKEVIYMQGIVRWCQTSAVVPEMPKTYMVGVEINIVDGVDVEQTIYYDQKYAVFWSELLERVLGSFSKYYRKVPFPTVLRGLLKDEEGRYLMLKRSSASRSWPSTWEFPGGKVDAAEHTTAALKREFLEETGLDIRPLHRFLEFSYDGPNGKMEYKIFFVEKISGVLAISSEHDDLKWVALEELSTLEVSPPIADVIMRLKGC